jgi:hypothetical protein
MRIKLTAQHQELPDQPFKFQIGAILKENVTSITTSGISISTHFHICSIK